MAVRLDHDGVDVDLHTGSISEPGQLLAGRLVDVPESTGYGRRGQGRVRLILALVAGNAGNA